MDSLTVNRPTYDNLNEEAGNIERMRNSKEYDDLFREWYQREILDWSAGVAESIERMETGEKSVEKPRTKKRRENTKLEKAFFAKYVCQEYVCPKYVCQEYDVIDSEVVICRDRADYRITKCGVYYPHVGEELNHGYACAKHYPEKKRQIEEMQAGERAIRGDGLGCRQYYKYFKLRWDE